jgi:phage repressor protein C with HTH and peptisase S24 domain
MISESVIVMPIIGRPNDQSQGTPIDQCVSLAYMKTLSDRISLAMSESGMSQTDLATACNVSQPSVNDWVSGKTRSLKASTALRAAAALDVGVLWLTEGTGPMRPTTTAPALQGAPVRVVDDDTLARDFAPVRRVRFKLSAGVSGYSLEIDDDSGEPIHFRKSWFAAKKLDPDKLLAVRVYGDSMIPNLYDDDLVVVNTADTTPKDGIVFAANYEGEMVIKRVRLEGGACWLDSDSSDQVRYRPRQCGEGCFILGRVVYKQSERI